jgi:hypothetical protein
MVEGGAGGVVEELGVGADLVVVATRLEVGQRWQAIVRCPRWRKKAGGISVL